MYVFSFLCCFALSKVHIGHNRMCDLCHCPYLPTVALSVSSLLNHRIQLLFDQTTPQLITPDRPLSAVMRLIWLKIRFRFAWNLSNLRASDQSYFFRSNGHFPGLRPLVHFTIYYQFNNRIGSFGCSPRVVFS